MSTILEDEGAVEQAPPVGVLTAITLVLALLLWAWTSIPTFIATIVSVKKQADNRQFSC
jgi:hypothetical protein